MNKKYKKPLKILIIVVVILLIALFIVNAVAKSKIETALSEMNGNTAISWNDLSVNALTGTVSIDNPVLEVKGKTTNKVNLLSKFETVEVSGFNSLGFLFSKEISADKLHISNGIVKTRKKPNTKNKDFKTTISEQLTQKLEIENIEIENIDFYAKDETFISNVTSLKAIHFNVENFKVIPNAKKLISYENLEFQSDAINHSMNKFDSLTAQKLIFKNNAIEFEDVQLKTKYSKTGLDKVIAVERDHFNVHLNDIKIQNVDYGFSENGRFKFTASNLLINSPNAEIYRNKLVANDPKVKPMYSQMLRELDFDLNINEVSVTDAKLVYEEKVKTNKPAGKIVFNKFNATITNLKNIDSTQTVNIKVNSHFMGITPLYVDWNFNVWDTTDYFAFKAQIGKMNAEQINQFTQPNVNVKLEGFFESNHFTITGNRNNANVDMKIKYDDFKVNILKDNGREENKFLSGIVNLFIKGGSKADENGLRYGHSDDVTRDKTKSIFNFIWLNAQAGLLSTIAGDGERENN